MILDEDFRVTISDLQRYHCVRGVKGWFATHGLDFKAFLNDGIMASELVASGDAMAERVVRLIAESRNG